MLPSCSRAAALALFSVVTFPGCDLNRMAADATVRVVEAGSEGVSGFWDYEIFGEAVPGALLQSEALVRVSPNNEQLLLGLAKSYVSYAYGWVQDKWELADDAGDFETADRIEARVMRLYQRAAQLSLRAVHLRDKRGELKQKLKSGNVEEVRAYLRENFKDKEAVPALYWAGLSWGSAMANSGGDVTQLADAPIARSLLERSVELDPTFADAGGMGVLGTVEASFPELFGGDLEKAKSYYDKALELCKRRNHLILLSYAKTYAVAKQDRELFLNLLNEILSAPDQGSDIRMSNKVARHRAERYIRKVEEWFPPSLEDAPLPEEGAPATAEGDSGPSDSASPDSAQASAVPRKP